MPKTEPAFTRTMQIGIVVPNLEAAIRSYEGVFGIELVDEFSFGIGEFCVELLLFM